MSPSKKKPKENNYMEMISCRSPKKFIETFGSSGLMKTKGEWEYVDNKPDSTLYHVYVTNFKRPKVGDWVVCSYQTGIKIDVLKEDGQSTTHLIIDSIGKIVDVDVKMYGCLPKFAVDIKESPQHEACREEWDKGFVHTIETTSDDSLQIPILNRLSSEIISNDINATIAFSRKTKQFEAFSSFNKFKTEQLVRDAYLFGYERGIEKKHWKGGVEKFIKNYM